MRLGKTAIVDWLSQFVISITGFVATFAIAVFLGKEPLGTYSVIVALGFWFLLLPMNAISKAVTKRMSEGTDPGAFFGAGTLLNGTAAAVLALVVLAAGQLLKVIRGTYDSELLTAFYDSEFVSVFVNFNAELVLLIVGTTAFLTMKSGLEGSKRVGTMGVLRALERLFRTGGQVAVAFVGLGAAALALTHAISLSLIALIGVGLLFAIHRPALPGRRHVRSILAYVRYGWLSTLQSRVFGWLDTIVLSLFVGAGLIGVYEAAWGIASLLATVSTSVKRTLFPEVSDLSTDEGFERIKHYLDEGLVFSGVLVIPGLLGAAVIGERVLAFYRPEFGQGATILVLLVAAYVGDVYGSQFISVLNGIDRPDISYRVNGAFIGANVVLNLALVPTIGWTGAAVATAVSSVLRMVFSYRALRSIIGEFQLPKKEIGAEVLAALVMAGAVFPVKGFVPRGRAGTLALVGFGALVYLVVLFAISARVREKMTALFRSVMPTGVLPES
jgi:O-antigen/teichoic acid export membrane protein